MKLFLFVLLGLVAMITCETVVEAEEEHANELSDNIEGSELRVKRAKFNMANYKQYKQGSRGWLPSKNE